MPLNTDKSATPALPGNGLVKIFDFDFVVWDASQVEVYYKNTDGIIVKLTSNFSVDLNPDQSAAPGGSITYPVTGDAISATESIVIQRDMPFVQMVDLESGKTFNAEVLEGMFNIAAAERQQLKEAVGRTAQARPGESGETYLEDCQVARVAAETARTGAETARDAAQAAQTGAETARDTTITYRDQAEVFKDQAQAASVSPWTVNGPDVERASGKVVAPIFEGIATQARYS